MIAHTAMVLGALCWVLAGSTIALAVGVGWLPEPNYPGPVEQVVADERIAGCGWWGHQ